VAPALVSTVSAASAQVSNGTTLPISQVQHQRQLSWRAADVKLNDVDLLLMTLAVEVACQQLL
jgi:hypothetical protein